MFRRKVFIRDFKIMVVRVFVFSFVFGGSVVVVVEGVVVVVFIYIILIVVVEFKGGDFLLVVVIRYLIYCKEIIFKYFCIEKIF